MMPKTEKLLQIIDSEYKKTGIKRTLFAACPNSISVIKAAIRSAKRNNAPIKFAATLNQVDFDKGYTGMTQKEFVQTIKLECKKINFNGPVIIAIDHGGPWLKDKDRLAGLTYEETLNNVKKSMIEAVRAGYDLLHVDPTVDVSLPEGEIISIETVAERTADIIAHVENFRKSNNFPAISYEVGTEEVHGGLADMNVFRRFFELLKKNLVQLGYPDVWPVFVVAKVGTDLHTSTFDSEVAKQVVNAAREYACYIKGHYSDNVTNPEAYPQTGMGGANVGPEFTENEYEGLEELINLETELYKKDLVPYLSDFKEILWKAVINSNRWKKWLFEEEKGLDFFNLKEDRQVWLIKTGCRYIWANPEVFAARIKLYENLEINGINAEEIVISKIQRNMDKYFFSFNLVNFNDCVIMA
jgi:tagatose-1,6-bisphosphate aldolase non-catalytic subunit AgaZ/GatZ